MTLRTKPRFTTSVDLLFRCGLGRSGGRPGFHQSMTFEAESFFSESSIPIQPEADAGGILKEARRFLFAGEPGEFRMERMIGREEGFLAMEDGWIGAFPVVVAPDLAGDEIDEHGFKSSPGSMRYTAPGSRLP